VPAADLRALYHTPGGVRGLHRRVGRLAVLRLDNEVAREVHVSHPFRSGDRFRFVVSSNQGGWLYLLHRSAGGEPELLWPRVEPGNPPRHLDDNRVQARQETLVPPPPGSFVFDEEVGTEHFFVVLRPSREPPRLFSAPAPSEHAVIPAPAAVAPAPVTAPPRAPPPRPGKPVAPPGPSPITTQRPQAKIVQFSVRGVGERGSAAVRGVVFDPGPQDPDPHVYFSAPAGSEASTTLFELQLRHDQ
jgi:hypothetical protein